MKYLKNIKDNFTKLDVPDISNIGYIVFEGDSIKYPYFQMKTKDELFLDDSDELFVIK